MQPFDVLATRVYNQGESKSEIWHVYLFLTSAIFSIGVDAKGRGLLYNGLSDAFLKIFKTEGIIGLYKGVFPTWMRIAPHTVLCLVFYEKLVQLF